MAIHRAEFAPAAPPVAPPAPTVDLAAVRAKHVKEAKASTSVFARTARKAALAEAERRTQTDVAAQAAEHERQHAEWQASLDQEWAALNTNDVNTVLAALAAAFEDNEAAAAAVGVDDAEVTLLVVVPPVSSIPERRPTTTAAGNLSMKKLTARETADLYKMLVCGHVVVTVKEAFAVAPGLISARVVAVRPTMPDAYGKVRPEIVLAARFERSALAGIQWDQADATQVVNDASSERIFVQKGAAQTLTAIDLQQEPQLAEIIAAVDIEELA